LKFLYASAALVLAASSASAQGAILSGAVADSIRGGYLRGASIFISGTNLSTTTDSSGRFKLARIPAGTRFIEVQHPLLDSLGLSLKTPPQEFKEGDSSFVLLSGPSATTYMASTCPADKLAAGPAAIVGTVAGTDGSPSGGGTAAASWIDYEVTRKAIKAVHQRRTANVSASGVFRICGLPDDLMAAVVVSRGADSTGSVDVDLRNIIGTVSLRFPSATANAFISGRVVDSNGKPASGARVTVEGDDAAATTESDGAFTVRGIRSGTRRLTVRKIGFEPTEQSLEIPSDGLSGATLALGRSVRVIERIIVSAKRQAGLDAVGFTERKLKRAGVFFEPKDIEIRNRPSLSDLLRTVPMMRRPGCTRYFIDGWLQPQGEPDEYLSGFDIGAVEVYAAGFVPPQYYSFTRSGGACRSVVIWTRWKIDRR
jgi:hypothetical protein